jgi:diguanylate cyclase
LNAAIALLAFCQASAPLLFLTAMPIMVSVFRFGAFGAILSTLIIAVVAEAFTIGGYGPIAALNIENLGKIFLLQLYIASQLLIALPVASVLADRQKKVDQILEDERLLRVAAEKAQRDAERAEHDKIRLLATDDLTGLASRRYVMEKCDRALQHAQIISSALSVAIFDADNFKLLNDKYGHAKGDEVLAMIGQVVRQSINDEFTVGRIGGEEFLIVMPDTDSIAAKIIVERLRFSISNARLSNSDIGTTISVGLASFDKACDLKVLLGRADQALYAAKHAGRNRFAVAA